jgi:hypothetical protein
VVVRNDYQLLLHTSSEATSVVVSWIAQMQAGLTDEQLEAKLVTTSTYYQLHGPSSSASWVNALFQDLLGRAASAQDDKTWLAAAVSQGAYKAAVALATCPEAETHWLTQVYGQYLHRAPATSEVTYWLSVLGRSASDESVIAALLICPQYYHQSTGT